MVKVKLLGLMLVMMGFGSATATAQPAMMINERLVPYIPHVLPPEAGGPPPSNPSQPSRTDSRTESARQVTACEGFLRTNPDVLRTVSVYAHGSARNPNMNAQETVSFVASTITEQVRNVASGDYFNRHASQYYQCLAHVDRSTISNLWPDLNAVVSEKEKREAIEAETQRRQRDVQQKREQVAQAEQLQRASKQAAVDALPANRLLRAYRLYIAVKQCFDARKGYAVVYLNEDQVAKSKTRVIAVERAMRASDPTIDPDAVWHRANAPDKDGTPANELAAVVQLADVIGRKWLSSPDWIEESDDYCKRSYSALSDLYASVTPSADVVKKDF